MAPFPVLFLIFRILFAPRLELIAENLALRQQLALLNRAAKRPKLRTQDRLFWATLSSLWKNWRSALIIIKPDTVLRWHREGFRNYWRWKSKARNSGRPKIDSEIRELIRRMSEENPLWGAPRIQAELNLLGFNVAESTVAKYRIKIRKPPSQTWKTFLSNHAETIAGIDFFTVPTATFRPTAAWTAQQMIEAFPEDASPRFLLRDRDSIYGAEFCSRVKGMQIEELITAPHSPWQSPYVERVIGSIRRECLNHLIVLSQEHLRKVLNGYVRYYNNTRPHESLGKNSPIPRVIESAKKGPIISIPEVGGLHHRYQRAA
jgi:putative transposase